MRTPNIVPMLGVAFLMVIAPCLLRAQQPAATQVMGGSGGASFFDQQPASGARILEVRVRAGDYVDSVQFAYVFPDGRTADGPRHGGGGGKLRVFRLDSDEYIVGISGRYGDLIDSIRFQTNKRTSQVFGGRGGSRDYNIVVPAGNMAIGFTGRAGDYLDAIGLTHMPLPRPSGPFRLTSLAGGRGGSPFADQDIPAGARIVEVRVGAGNWIDSIRAVYLLPNGGYSEGPRHGGGGGRTFSFRLDSDEYITGISGRYGEYLDSIRIHTNKRTSQKYGGGGGDRDFRLDVPAGNQVMGFAGRSGDYVDAIGLTYTRIDSPSRWQPFRRQRR